MGVASWRDRYSTVLAITAKTHGASSSRTRGCICPLQVKMDSRLHGNDKMGSLTSAQNVVAVAASAARRVPPDAPGQIVVLRCGAVAWKIATKRETDRLKINDVGSSNILAMSCQNPYPSLFSAWHAPRPALGAPLLVGLGTWAMITYCTGMVLLKCNSS